ncbi:MAG: hypothetical protein ACI4CC_07470 [Lachnospiraceae bacterium]
MKKQRRKILWVLVLFMIMLTGCSQKLAEKEVVLVADAESLVKGERREEQVIQEFSHLKLLVIHEAVDDTLIQTLLNKDEISFQTRVAYSEENISENIVKEEESLTDQMRHYRFRNTVTVLELMNSYYDPKSVLYLPKIEIKDGEIKEKEAVVFKEGKRWESFR